MTADLDALAARLQQIGAELTQRERADLRAAASAMLALRKERDDVEACRAECARLLLLREDEIDQLRREQAEEDAGCTLALKAAHAVQVEAWAKFEAERARAATAERELADANAHIAHAAEAYSTAIRERNVAQADTALLRECAELVDRLRELRAPRDIEEGSLMLNTCDYYALDDLSASLRAALDARPEPAGEGEADASPLR
jgi:hypothetical protein